MNQDEEDTLNLLSLAEELEELIRSTIPKSHTVSKYGGTLFTLKPEEKEAQFCGVFIYKQHVQISISKGALLSDPMKLQSGSGKLRRHINFKSFNDVHTKALKNLLIQSSKL